MLINYEINTNLEINCLTDLNKLEDLQNNGLKVNKSALARRLGKDRRTINKYINGYQKSNSRHRTSLFDEYYDIIDQLLNDNYKVFAYKRVLWQYLKDNYGLNCAQSSFRRYISSIEKFNQYFKEKRKPSKLQRPVVLKQNLVTGANRLEGKYALYIKKWRNGNYQHLQLHHVIF